jgi:hypothetical protein
MLKTNQIVDLKSTRPKLKPIEIKPVIIKDPKNPQWRKFNSGIALNK